MWENDLLFLGIEELQRNYFDSDDALFHYTKSTTAIEYILKDMKLKCSKLSNFSDPKEKFFFFPTAAMCGEGDIGVSYDNIYKELVKLKEQIGIICFCSNEQLIEHAMMSKFTNHFKNRLGNFVDFYSPHPGYDKDRMWEIYAEKSYGVCLVFSKEELIKQIKENNYEHVCKYVAYHRKLFDAIGGFDCNSNPRDEAKKFLERKVFKKHFDYRDENEFRTMIYNDCSDDFYIDIKCSLKAIIFGANFKELYFPLYSNIIDNNYKLNHVVLLKAVLDKGVPHFYFKNLRDN